MSENNYININNDKQTMKILLRISNMGNPKNKISSINNKKLAFLHILSTLGSSHELYVFADNVTDDLYEFFTDNYDSSNIFRTSLGNHGSLLYVLDFAIQKFKDDDSIYVCEDDYIYIPKAMDIINEGLQISHYSSGYDHPDKYFNRIDGGPNPYISNGGEVTRVVVTENSHWKHTNSLCMTFAAKLKTLKEDYNYFVSYPADFQLFTTLRNKEDRICASCIPSVSTHGELEWLAKFIDWENIFINSIQQDKP
jgi:hypothetical protein